MRLSKVSLKNFRGIRDKIVIDINDSDKPYAIVGNNESGKTTILQGLEIIGKLCSNLEIDTLTQKLISASRPRIMMFDGVMILEAFIVLDESFKYALHNDVINQLKDDNEIKIEFSFSFSGDAPEYTKFSRRLVIGGESVQEPDELLKLIASHLQAIIYYDEFLFEVPKKVVFDKSNPNNTVDEQNGRWQNILNDLWIGALQKDKKAHAISINSFRKQFVEWSVKDEHEMQMRQNLKSLNLYFTDIVSKDWEDTTGEKSLFKNFEIQRNVNVGNSNLIEFKFVANNENSVFSISERSKGCQWFFCFKILTEVRKNREQKGMMFLLDEPASNLHIHPQEKILKSLEKLSSSSNVQIVYTTHSPFLINLDNKENIIVVDNYALDDAEYPQITCRKFSDIKEVDLLNKNQSLKPIVCNRIISLVQEGIPEALEWAGSKAKNINAIKDLFGLSD